MFSSFFHLRRHLAVVPPLSHSRPSTDALASACLIRRVHRSTRVCWHCHTLADTECVCLEAHSNVFRAYRMLLSWGLLLLPLRPLAPKLAEFLWSVMGISGVRSLVFSGALAVYYLLVNKATRTWGESSGATRFLKAE